MNGIFVSGEKRVFVERGRLIKQKHGGRISGLFSSRLLNRRCATWSQKDG